MYDSGPPRHKFYSLRYVGCAPCNMHMLKLSAHMTQSLQELGRVLLFVAVHLMTSCLILIIYAPADATLPNMIWSIYTCDRRQKYCGEICSYGWDGLRNVKPTPCANLAQLNVLVFCDGDYKVSHFKAFFMVCMVISLIVWAVIWTVTDIMCLGVISPSVSTKNLGSSHHVNLSDVTSCQTKAKSEWQQALSLYYTKCLNRAQMVQAGSFWGLLNSLHVIAEAIVNTFIVTYVSIWYYGHPSIGLFSKLFIPVMLQAMFQLVNDPNFVAKAIYAVKRSLKTKKKAKHSAHGKALPIYSDDVTKSWSDRVCMLIACHYSASSEFEAHQLRKTLEAALVHLPANHIFVCDNASNDAPPDDTWSVVENVSPNINYLYIPIGSKSFAFYWTEKYWLPYVQSCGILQQQARDYILIADDDVRLPANFSVPVKRLFTEKDITAVQYPVVASDPLEHKKEGKPLLIGLQDIEYMALNQIPEALVPPPVSAFSSGILSWCSPLYCSGALSVWRREDFRDVMRRHDAVFHGEDLQMGLLTIARRNSKRIIACDDRKVVIPTSVPTTISDLLRQRVKSWELIIFAWGTSFFLLEMMRSAYHSMRGHKTSMKTTLWCLGKLVTTLAVHNPSTALVQVLVLFFLFPKSAETNIGTTKTVLLIMSVSLHYIGPMVYYSHAFGHIEKWRLPTIKELLMWPVYMSGSAWMSFLAYIYNLTVYGHANLPPSIESRERVGDVPPCPRDPFPDWSTVWKLGESADMFP